MTDSVPVRTARRRIRCGQDTPGDKRDKLIRQEKNNGTC